MQINYKHLRYFWAVAHEGNLTRAAARLNVSQSALSTQIQTLEHQLGHDLFERRGRKMHLTEAGHIALEHADAVFSLGEELVASLRGTPGKQRLSVRVGANLNLSRNFQLSFLEPVLGDPDVHLAVYSGRLQELLIGIETHDLDVVLTNRLPHRDTNSNWFAKLIDDQPISLIGTSGKAYAGKSFPELISQNPLILPASESSIRKDFDALIESMDVMTSTVIEADDMAMLRLLTRSGAGLAILPPIVVRDELASGELQELAAVPTLHERFYAITRTRRFPNPVVKKLIESAEGAEPKPQQ
ncbi:MAG: LysR family transcriptional regulator [Pseudomonadota bacterium]